MVTVEVRIVKHSKLNRLMRILTTLQSGKGCTVDDLSRMLGASRRTIFRDLKVLHDVGVPHRYDTKTGYYTISPEYFLPPADLELREALSLLLLAEKVSEQIQLPFRREALQAALKIENNLPVGIRQRCSSILKNISTRTDIQASIRHSGRFDNIFVQLQEAIANKRIVNVCYRLLFDGSVVNLKLCPYHLLYNNGTWHVLGRSSLNKKIRTFELNHIDELKMTTESFLIEDDFDVSEYLGRAWSTMPEGRIYNVKLLFLAKVAKDVIEVKWHSTQKVTPNGDGSAIVEFRVDGLNEITWWVLRYGDQVQVLTPQALRNRVLDIAKNMIKLNENG